MSFPVRFVTSATTWAQLPDDGLPEIAFIGRSNVGKSSLVNMLVGRKALAHTSGKPGKTRTFNYYVVAEDEEEVPTFYIVDLPGYGYAKTSQKERARWGEFIGRYLTERVPLRLAIHLVDSRHPPTRQDKDVMGLMRGSPVPYVIALTKSDKLSGNGRAKAKREVEKALAELAMEVPVVLTSAEDGRGRDELLTWIRDMALV